MSSQFQPVSERQTPFIGQLPRGLEKLPDPIEEETFKDEKSLNKRLFELESERILEEILGLEQSVETSEGWVKRAEKRKKLLENFGGVIYGGPDPINDLLADRYRGYFDDPGSRFGGRPWSHERMFGPLGGKI